MKTMSQLYPGHSLDIEVGVGFSCLACALWLPGLQLKDLQQTLYGAPALGKLTTFLEIQCSQRKSNLKKSAVAEEKSDLI